MKVNKNTEKGHTIVEATFVYPVVILVFIVIFYAAIFVFKKAGLQVNLENALLYGKSEMTDNYINMLDSFANNGEFRSGNKFEIPSEYKNPYRNAGSAVMGAINGMPVSPEFSGKIESFSKTAYGQGDINVSIGNIKDYYIFKTIEVTGSRSLDAAININMVGGKNHMKMENKVSITVVDGDNLIRDIDFMTDLISDTKFGKKIEENKEKIIGKYNSLIEKLGKK